MLITLIALVLLLKLTAAIPVIAEPTGVSVSSSLNMTTRNIQYSKLGAIDVADLCDPNWTHTGHTCYFATWTHGPLSWAAESATHALYAFRSDCTLIGYLPSINLGPNEKFSFSTLLPKFIDVRYNPKKGYGWAPDIYYDSQHWTKSQCWYEDQTKNPLGHTEGACKIWFYC